MDLQHKSVLMDEVIKFINPQPNKVYLDVTFGCGGHTRAILEKEPNCKVIALDWDKTVINQYNKEFKDQFGDRITLIWGNFADLYKILKRHGISEVDGILADFGTSQYQINSKDGFSFRIDTPLDMRMSNSHNFLTAEMVLEKYPEIKLLKIFAEYGEEKNAKAIARAIVETRKKQKINTTLQLANLVESIYRSIYHEKSHVHPATKVFQALRIYVNKELDHINGFLSIAPKYLKQGAPIICISFHSLEDRLVKDFFRNNPEKINNFSQKPITASDAEISKNSSSRSAKLRVAYKS